MDCIIYLLINIRILFIILCVWVFYLQVCLCTLYLWRPEEGFGSLRTGVTDDCELPSGSWWSNPVSLQEQPVLLSI